MKIGISGASGLIGQKLSSALQKQAHDVVPLVRRESETGVYWNYEKREIDLDGLSQLDGIIHLAGQGIADQRWTDSYKRRIHESRSLGTSFLVENILKLDQKPKFFISASAIGYYGNRGDEKLTEEHSAGKGFLAQVCVDWESAARPLEPLTRLCIARIGVVLSTEGGALKQMLPPFKLGLGGPLGSGEQYMPWIDIRDIVSAFIFLVENESQSGVFNFCSPEPIQNKAFTNTLAKTLHRPAFFSVPKFALKLVAGEMGNDLLLSSTRVIPKRLQEAGFSFQFPSLESSLDDLLS